MYDLKTVGPTPANLASIKMFSGVIVPLVQLAEAIVSAGGGHQLQGLSFKDCAIRGPAVLIPGERTRFENCNMGDVAGDVRNLFLKAAGPRIAGGILANECRFDGCLFVGVGFAGDDAFVEGFVRELSAPKLNP